MHSNKEIPLHSEYAIIIRHRKRGRFTASLSDSSSVKLYQTLLHDTPALALADVEAWMKRTGNENP